MVLFTKLFALIESRRESDWIARVLVTRQRVTLLLDFLFSRIILGIFALHHHHL